MKLLSVAGSGEMAQHRPAAGSGPPHTRAGGGGWGAEQDSQGAGHQGRQAQASGTHSYPTSFHKNNKIIIFSIFIILTK